jgi:iron complex transport system permease protein
VNGATAAVTERWRAAYLTPRRFARVIGALLVLLVVTVVVSCGVGSERIDLWNALVGASQENVDRLILLRIRVPRALLGVVVGAALSAAGTALQALLRNPLAEPHIIGVSGGAALGGVVALVIGGTADANRAWLVPLGAFAGALATMAVVYRLGSVRGRVQPYTLLLAGVVCNGFTGALIMFVNAVADFFQAHNILFWLMGSLATQSYRLVAAIAVYVIAAVLWLLFHTRDFNALALGEEGAQQLGVNVQRTRRAAFVVSSFLVGAAVSVSGMIGFVGLIVPHVTRLLFGADYRLLLPASVILGGCFLVVADTVARTALGAVEIPVGVVTALCGGPFFLYLLRREGVRQLG